MVAAALLCVFAQSHLSLDDIVAPNSQVEKVAGGYQFLEGPAWTRHGTLVWSDQPPHKMFEMVPGQPPHVFREDSHHSNGNTIDPQGRIVTCEQALQRVVRQEKDGRFTVIADRFEGKRFNSPNDVVVRRNGEVFFTDPPYGLPQGATSETGFNGVYRVKRDGTVECISKSFYRPNGIVFSPDEKHLYVNDTERHLIKIFDVQRDGTVVNERLFATLPGPNPGYPDGMRVDRNGNLYCTGGGIHVYAPDGFLIGRIAVTEEPANCGWGDRDGKTLYMTARTGLYRIRTKTAGVRF